VRRRSKDALAIGLAMVFVAVALFGLYRKLDPTVAQAEHLGTLEALHQQQSNVGARIAVFYVRLATNEVVAVVPPELTPFRQGAKVRVVETAGESGLKRYTFIEYVPQ
jgi:hypothetical protein